MDARNQAGREIQERTVSKMEEDNRQIRSMRMEIQRLTHDKEVMEAYQRKSEDLEEECAEVRSAYRELEDRFKELCANPFINIKSTTKQEHDELLQLKRVDQQKRLQVQHLQVRLGLLGFTRVYSLLFTVYCLLFTLLFTFTCGGTVDIVYCVYCIYLSIYLSCVT